MALVLAIEPNSVQADTLRHVLRPRRSWPSFRRSSGSAQRAVDEIDCERERLVIPEQRPIVVPLDGWPEPDTGRR